MAKGEHNDQNTQPSVRKNTQPLAIQTKINHRHRTPPGVDAPRQPTLQVARSVRSSFGVGGGGVCLIGVLVVTGFV